MPASKRTGIGSAAKRLRDLIATRPCLFDQTTAINAQFREAVLKDERGIQAHRHVDDWVERLTPMEALNYQHLVGQGVSGRDIEHSDTDMAPPDPICCGREGQNRPDAVENANPLLWGKQEAGRRKLLRSGWSSLQTLQTVPETTVAGPAAVPQTT